MQIFITVLVVSAILGVVSWLFTNKKVDKMQDELDKKNAELSDCKNKVEGLNLTNKNLEIELAKVKVEKEHLENEIKKDHEDKNSIVMQFQNIATAILEEKTQKFTEKQSIIFLLNFTINLWKNQGIFHRYNIK